ncbi:MAG: hypothetical protein H6606_10185 [Flavobacteriales bacterium]|nr:hypothetical protein [Flavobacteriales bacterium]
MTIRKTIGSIRSDRFLYLVFTCLLVYTNAFGQAEEAGDDQSISAFLSNLPCLVQLNVTDPAIVSYMEQYGFQLIDRKFHRNSYDSDLEEYELVFSHGAGYRMKFVSVRDRKIFRMELKIAHIDAFRNIAPWLHSEWKIESNFKTTCKKLKKQKLLNSFSRTKTEGVLLFNKSGLFGSLDGRWDITEKKNNWLKSLSVAWYGNSGLGSCSGEIAVHTPISFPHRGFDPGDSSTFHLLLGQKLCEEQIGHLRKYYGWYSKEGIFKNWDERFGYKLSPERGMGCIGFRVTEVNYYDPDKPEWNHNYGQLQLRLTERYLPKVFNCGHFDSTVTFTHCVTPDKKTFQMVNVRPRNGYREAYILRGYSESFQFEGSPKLLECVPEVGCISGDCKNGTGTFYLTDGCSFTGLFYNEKAWRGTVKTRSGWETRKIDLGLTPDEKNKEEERKKAEQERKRQSEVVETPKAPTKPANTDPLTEFWQNQIRTWNDQVNPTFAEIKREYGKFKEHHRKAYKFGEISPTSADFASAQKHYRACLAKMNELVPKLEKLYLAFYSKELCGDLKNEVFSMHLDLDMARDKFRSFEPYVWEYDAKDFNTFLVEDFNKVTDYMKRADVHQEHAAKDLSDCYNSWKNGR